MQVTRRDFLGQCAICGAMLTLGGCCARHPRSWWCQPCPPPITPPRGVDPPNITPFKVPPWPVDPNVVNQILTDWSNRPKPARQDGMWPYLVIRSFPGDFGARPSVRRFSSPDVLVAEGFPAPPPSFENIFLCNSRSPCTIYVRVWNVGSLGAFPVTLRVYSTWSDDNSPWSNRKYRKPQLVGGMYLNLGDKTQRSCEQLVQLPVPWVPENAPTAYSWAILAVASATTDPPGNLPPGIEDSASDRHVGATFLDKSWALSDGGTLGTQVPPNSIQWSIKHGAMEPGWIMFRLAIASNASQKPKIIEFHDKTGTLLWKLRNGDPGSLVEAGALSNQIGSSAYLQFAIEGIGPVVFPTPLGGMACLKDRDQVTFTWYEA